jgi:hypothetical protein
MTDKLLLALAATVLAVVIAAVNVPPAGGKSDALKTYRPAETACTSVDDAPRQALARLLLAQQKLL